MKPQHCFCHYRQEDLIPVMTICEKDGTTLLIDHARNDTEREMAKLINLIEVLEDELIEQMSETGMSREHLVECRRNALVMLHNIRAAN